MDDGTTEDELDRLAREREEQLSAILAERARLAEEAHRDAG